ncbi:MAG: hypothetical protein E6G83_17510 [Alphaproteobacteria bacterium]|nr:MAG: hypothetical protein E6G83_17510 [Alphaproteobacteria bacterium]
MSAQLFPLAPGVSVAGRLDRADIDALAAAGVRTIINNRPDGEDAGQLPAAEARRIAEAHGIAYHQLGASMGFDPHARGGKRALADRRSRPARHRHRRSAGRRGAVALEGQAAEGVGSPTVFPKIPAKGDRRRNDKTSAASPTTSHHHTSSRPIQKNTSARELRPSPGTGETIAWRARRNNSSHMTKSTAAII